MIFMTIKHLHILITIISIRHFIFEKVICCNFCYRQ